MLPGAVRFRSWCEIRSQIPPQLFGRVTVFDGSRDVQVPGSSLHPFVSRLTPRGTARSANHAMQYRFSIHQSIVTFFAVTRLPTLARAAHESVYLLVHLHTSLARHRFAVLVLSTGAADHAQGTTLTGRCLQGGDGSAAVPLFCAEFSRFFGSSRSVVARASVPRRGWRNFCRVRSGRSATRTTSLTSSSEHATW